MEGDDAREGLGAPEQDLSGTTIDEAVDTAESGTQVEGEHTPSGRAPSGESRLEQMVEVEEKSTEGDGVGGASVPHNPDPTEIGSGGAQRIEGARMSDRTSAGEPVPDGPPFDDNDRPSEGEGS